MTRAVVNGVELYYELHGSGRIPLVLVHGSWDSHQDWDPLVPHLVDSFRVLSYDRRGHSASERPTGQGSVREDVADLAALIEHLNLAPAWVAGDSFGASIALRLAGERPDLLRGLIGHEPPLFALLADDPAVAPMLEEVGRAIAAVVTRIAAGDNAGAAEQFVETIAPGPGTWERLPAETRRIMTENAPTFLDESNDPDQLGLDLESLAAFAKPTLLTLGDQSPPAFELVANRLEQALPVAEVVAIPGASHIPHITHPAEYARTITEFVERNSS